MQSGITDKQIEQAKKILLLGNEGFWDVLKRLYQSQGIWESQKPILLKELKQCKYSVCYRSVLVKENEKKLLLEAVTENPYNLFYYAQFLVMDYPNEIYELCANYIREQCAQATDRRLYKKVCKDLLQLIKWKMLLPSCLWMNLRQRILEEVHYWMSCKGREEIVSVSWLLHLVLLFYCCFGKWLCSAGSDADALLYKDSVQVKIFLVIYPNGFYYKIVVGK